MALQDYLHGTGTAVWCVPIGTCARKHGAVCWKQGALVTAQTSLQCCAVTAEWEAPAPTGAVTAAVDLQGGARGSHSTACLQDCLHGTGTAGR